MVVKRVFCEYVCLHVMPGRADYILIIFFSSSVFDSFFVITLTFLPLIKVNYFQIISLKLFTLCPFINQVMCGWGFARVVVQFAIKFSPTIKSFFLNSIFGGPVCFTDKIKVMNIYLMSSTIFSGNTYR